MEAWFRSLAVDGVGLLAGTVDRVGWIFYYLDADPGRVTFQSTLTRPSIPRCDP
jgi:hypothetical protein